MRSPLQGEFSYQKLDCFTVATSLEPNAFCKLPVEDSTQKQFVSGKLSFPNSVRQSRPFLLYPTEDSYLPHPTFDLDTSPLVT